MFGTAARLGLSNHLRSSRVQAPRFSGALGRSSRVAKRSIDLTVNNPSGPDNSCVKGEENEHTSTAVASNPDSIHCTSHWVKSRNLSIC